MKNFYPIYLSNISVLFCLYQTEVPFEILIIEITISDVSRRSKWCNSKHYNLRSKKQRNFFLQFFRILPSI